jgi:translation initiation factor 1
VTVIEGLDEKQVNIKDLAKKLKSELACGGTSKDGRIELQGRHRQHVKDVLIELGFSPEMIDMR